VSIVLSLATLAPIVYAIKTVAEDGFSDTAVAAASVGVLAGALFVRRQLRSEHPMLDLRLFRVGAFGGAVVANLLSLFAMVGFLYFISQHLQLVLGLSPLDAALTLVPGAIASVVIGLTAVALVRRFPVRVVMAAGFALSSLAYLLVVLVAREDSPAGLVLAFVLLSAGIGAAETLSNDAILTAAPPSRAGAASAISETAYELGAVLGTAVLGSILAASYRANVELPTGLTTAQAHQAGETLGGATTVAGQLPTGIGSDLLTSARAAFDSGVTTTAGIGALVTLAAAVLVFLTVKPKPTS
jgi:DHA2 family multidrug resistance protein-like MFS transporter